MIDKKRADECIDEIKDIKKHLNVINSYREGNGYFELITKSNRPISIVLNHDGYQTIIYSFKMKNFLYRSLILISESEFYALQNGMNNYWQKANDFQKISKRKNGLTAAFDDIESNDNQKKPNDNQFKNLLKPYADRLAKKLLNMNEVSADDLMECCWLFIRTAIFLKDLERFEHVEED